MAITYSSGTITIAGETATPEDLWDADQAGGWGVVSRQGLSVRYQYYIAAQISLGVGGHFVGEELDVIINGGSKSPIVSTSSDSGMRFGAIDANGDTYNGCSVTFVCTSTASLIEFPVGAANLSSACDFEVYASTVDGYFAASNGLFGRFYRGDDQIVKIRDSTFQNMKFGMRLRGTASFLKDVEFSNISGIFSPFTTYGELGGGISGILVRKSYQGAYFQSDFGDATVRNFAARNNTRTMNFRNVAGSSGNYYSIDGNLETPLDIFWQFNNTVSKFFVQFSFNKTYKKASDSSPLEGARVYIEDADGTQATNATTNASGVLAEQILTKETYRYLDGDTPTALTPHVVKVRKYGYLLNEVSISVDAKIEGVDFVGNNPFIVADEATAAGYSSEATITGSTKSISVTGTLTKQQLYDLGEVWSVQSGNMQYAKPFTDPDTLNTGWIITVSGKLTGDGVYNTTPTVTTGGFFEDAGGAIKNNAGTLLYLTAITNASIINQATSVGIENSVFAYGNETVGLMTYDKDLNLTRLVGDENGKFNGYLEWKRNSTVHEDCYSVAGYYGYNGAKVPRSLNGTPIVNEVTRLSVDGEVTKTRTEASAITGITFSATGVDMGDNTLADTYDRQQYLFWNTTGYIYGTTLACMEWCLNGKYVEKSRTTYTGRSAGVYQNMGSGGSFSTGIVEMSSGETPAFTVGTMTLKMTATGSYDYSEVSFIGTVDFNNASGGAVTIEVENGVDYTTSGSPLPTIIEPQIYQSVTISGAVAGSLLQVYDTTNSEQLYLGNPTFPYTWTDDTPYAGDRAIRIRLMYVDGDEAKTFIEQNIGTATEENPAVSVSVEQTDLTIYNQNAIDGSTVTGVTFLDDDDDDRVLIDVAVAGTISWQEIYAAYVVWIFTEVGIASDTEFIFAKDQANYVLENMKIKNTSSPSVPLKITGGYGTDATTEKFEDLVDTTGGNIYPVPDIVIPFQYTTLGEPVITGDIADVPTANENAAAVKAELEDGVNVAKINNHVIIGGTDETGKLRSEDMTSDDGF
jgi:hypothetical protein